MVFKKRIKSHVFEKIMVVFMILVGFSGVYVFVEAIKNSTMGFEVALIQLNLILMLTMIIQCIMLVKIYEKVE
jgi:hypothetical protein